MKRNRYLIGFKDEASVFGLSTHIRSMDIHEANIAVKTLVPGESKIVIYKLVPHVFIDRHGKRERSK